MFVFAFVLLLQTADNKNAVIENKGVASDSNSSAGTAFLSCSDLRRNIGEFNLVTVLDHIVVSGSGRHAAVRLLDKARLVFNVVSYFLQSLPKIEHCGVTTKFDLSRGGFVDCELVHVAFLSHISFVSSPSGTSSSTDCKGLLSVSGECANDCIVIVSKSTTTSFFLTEMLFPSASLCLVF